MFHFNKIQSIKDHMFNLTVCLYMVKNYVIDTFGSYGTSNWIKTNKIFISSEIKIVFIMGKVYTTFETV